MGFWSLSGVFWLVRPSAWPPLQDANPSPGPVHGSLLKTVGPHLPQEVRLGYAILPVTIIPTPLLTSLPLRWSQGFSISFFSSMSTAQPFRKESDMVSPTNKQGGGSLATVA